MLFIFNQLSNIDLIIIVQKVGGTNDTPFPTFQKVWGTCPPVPPPPTTPMIMSNVPS